MKSFHWLQRHHDQATTWDEVADWISENIGSWPSVWLHSVWFVAWFIFRLDVDVLTLIVSLEAIYLCVFLLMSGNRQAERDRHQADADYATNLMAKEEIEALQKDLARIEIEKLDAIIAILRAAQPVWPSNTDRGGSPRD